MLHLVRGLASYWEGIAAFKLGLPKTEVPYMATEYQEMWLLGWEEAEFAYQNPGMENPETGAVLELD